MAAYRAGQSKKAQYIRELVDDLRDRYLSEEEA
jgi:hypothetical protein